VALQTQGNAISSTLSAKGYSQDNAARKLRCLRLAIDPFH